MRVLIFPDGTPNALIENIPVDDGITVMVIIFLVLIPISGIIGALLGGNVLSPIIMILHK